jgi:hypothetical protein
MSKFAPLKRQLEDNGWKITSIEIPSHVWWAFDIWELRSIWRPIDKVIYLTLLFDPMSSTTNETDVWSIVLSRNTMAKWNDENIDHDVGIVRKFAERSGKVIGLANSLRDSL